MAEQSEDDVGTELVLEPGTFTGPERREVQQRLKIPFADLMTYTHEAVQRLYSDSPGDPLRPLPAPDGVLVFPDEVLQVMVWVQARRTNPEAALEDFDDLTMRDLNSARIRGIQGKASSGGPSTTSPPESPSADSSPA